MPKPPVSPEPPTATETPESPEDGDRLLYPHQVRKIFGVSASTLQRWASDGLITAQRTLGGHRRYRESEVRDLAGRTVKAVA